MHVPNMYSFREAPVMGVWPDGIFISLSGLETRFTSGPFDGVTSWRPLLGLASSSTCEPSYRLPYPPVNRIIVFPFGFRCVIFIVVLTCMVAQLLKHRALWRKLLAIQTSWLYEVTPGGEKKVCAFCHV